MLIKTQIVIPLVVIGIVVIAFAGFCFYINSAFDFGSSDKVYHTADLIKSFNEKRSQIYEAKAYFNKIVPKYKNVAIEFENNDEIARLDIIPVDTGRGSDITGFTDWNLKIKSKKVDSLLSILGWDVKTLSTLKAKLDKANCIYIKSGEPANIGFKRSGMGMYFFNVFNKPMSDGVKRRYTADSCTYIYVNRQLILEYGGGAIGPQCFPRQDITAKPQ